MLSKRLLPLAAALGLTLAGAACGDDNLFEASIKNTEPIPFQVYALSGTAPELPSAYEVGSASIIRVDSLQFDVAFDLSPAGRISLYPLRTLGQPLSGRSIGIRVDSTSGFDNVRRAPGRGFVRDSVVTFGVGHTVVLETPFAQCNIYSISRNIYSKLVVDSASLASRKIYFRSVTNRNCGFRSLVPNVIPKD